MSGYNDNDPARLTNGENARDEFCNVVTLYVPDLFSNVNVNKLKFSGLV